MIARNTKSMHVHILQVFAKIRRRLRSITLKKATSPYSVANNLMVTVFVMKPFQVLCIIKLFHASTIVYMHITQVTPTT